MEAGAEFHAAGAPSMEPFHHRHGQIAEQGTRSPQDILFGLAGFTDGSRAAADAAPCGNGTRPAQPDDYPGERIVRPTRPFFKSTFSTHTVTTSPTATTSIGCLTKRSLIWEMWTRPSFLMPMSTKAPKSMTLRTVPGAPCRPAGPRSRARPWRRRAQAAPRVDPFPDASGCR